MCGIVGYIGNDQAAPVLLQGLEKLEYRGYDSAGVAVFSEDGLKVVKSKGRLRVLSDLLDGGKALTGTLGIGHTRWATHGAPSDVNSHPQVSEGGQVLPLCITASSRIISTSSSTSDAPRRTVRIGNRYRGCRADARILRYRATFWRRLKRSSRKVEGSYALGIISADHPDCIVRGAQGQPAHHRHRGRAKTSSPPTFPRSYQKRVRSAA